MTIQIALISQKEGSAQEAQTKNLSKLWTTNTWKKKEHCLND